MRYAIVSFLSVMVLLSVWQMTLFFNRPSQEVESGSLRPSEPSLSPLSEPIDSNKVLLEDTDSHSLDTPGKDDDVTPVPPEASIKGYLYSMHPEIPVDGLGMMLIPLRLGSDLERLSTRRTTSNSLGEFSFDDIAPGEYHIQLNTPGRSLAHQTAVLHTIAPENHITGLALEVVTGGTMTGRVYELDTGAPVAGAYIAALPAPMRKSRDNVHFGAMSDTAGMYRMECLPPGAYEVFYLGITDPDNPTHVPPVSYMWSNAIDLLMHDYGAVFGYSQMLSAKVKAGETTDHIDVPIHSASKLASISGHVFMPDGTPAVDANVLLTFAGDAMAYLHLAHQVVTDENGYFETGAMQVNGYYKLEVVKGQARLEKDIGLLTDAGIQRLKLNLERHGNVNGVVLSPSGDPYYQLPLLVTGTPVNVREQERVGSSAGRKIWTEADGSFQCNNLKSGVYHVYAYQDTHPGAFLGELGSFEIEDGISVSELRFTLTPPENSISGRVVTKEGEPVAQANISPHKVWSVLRQVSSSNEGSFFLFPMEKDQEYSPIVHKAPYAIAELHPVRGGMHNLEVVLDDGLTLRGKVVNARTGEPITLYQIRATSLHNWIPPGEERERHRREFRLTSSCSFYRTHIHLIKEETAQYHPGGSFSISGIGDNLSLYVGNATGYHGHSLLLEDITPVDVAGEHIIALQEKELLQGRVVDTQHRPIPGALVRFGNLERHATRLMDHASLVRTSQSGSNIMQTDSEGRFHIYVPHEVTITGLIASHEDFVADGVAIPASRFGQQNIQIMLEAGGIIEGRITRAGRPMGNVQVRFETPEFDEWALVRYARTDATGQFQMNGIPTCSGVVHIRAHMFSEDSPAGAPQEIAVDVVSGFVTVLNHELLD